MWTLYLLSHAWLSVSILLPFMMLAFPLPTIRLGTFGLVPPEVEITTTELAKKSRKDLGRCHPKEIENSEHTQPTASDWLLR